jgi:hypothetical protein
LSDRPSAKTRDLRGDRPLDRPEDEACAKNAGINFMWANIFRQRFLPGMYEVQNATKEQVAFLENIKL